ncbi:hypothetical protein EDEG_01190 [Edhazardia aedis USNM 41457]|uniref:NFACT RNA-binding domain-containing protein n=1 Tax=Edhazardia aedis (strain USNM 41457) TaxID=1003232 RepID=J9DA55_EDHAE|nr:hypothetical protein EDEG_01190 [Edhazardia aedis USNM 41457]|eukprot:EJW04606.1 hypothetical protein EDEG_01190 [Edhazardia aedis USNM 41457]
MLVIAGRSAQENDLLVKKHLSNDDLFFHADVAGAATVILKNGVKCLKNDLKPCVSDINQISNNSSTSLKPCGQNLNAKNTLNDINEHNLSTTSKLKDNIKQNLNVLHNLDTSKPKLETPLKNKSADFGDYLSIEETASMALCLSKFWKEKVTGNVYYVKSDQVSKKAQSGEYLKAGSFMIRGKKNYVDVYRLEYGIGIVFKICLNNVFKDDDININEFENKKIVNADDIVKNIDQLTLSKDSNINKILNKSYQSAINEDKDIDRDSNKKINNQVSFGEDCDISVDNQTNIDNLNNKNISNQVELSLHNFITHVQENTIIEHAMVISGPWQIIKNFKYKERLVPAVEKKGKLVTSLHKKFIHASKNTIEEEFVKKITPDEISTVLIKDCRVGKI